MRLAITRGIVIVDINTGRCFSTDFDKKKKLTNAREDCSFRQCRKSSSIIFERSAL